MQGTPTTTRLRKLECAGCGYTVRVSRKWLAVGLPSCACGARLLPAALEDALACHEAGTLTDDELSWHPERLEYEHEVANLDHGRAPKAQKWGEENRRETAKTRDGRRTTGELALDRVHVARSLAAHKARHAALAENAFGGCKSNDEWPF